METQLSKQEFNYIKSIDTLNVALDKAKDAIAEGERNLQFANDKTKKTESLLLEKSENEKKLIAESDQVREEIKKLKEQAIKDSNSFAEITKEKDILKQEFEKSTYAITAMTKERDEFKEQAEKDTIVIRSLNENIKTLTEQVKKPIEEEIIRSAINENGRIAKNVLEFILNRKVDKVIHVGKITLQRVFLSDGEYALV